ncbi:helix-turn-helix transcriptional regulator [Streptomyces sp. NPDC001634]|uniref:helix-turn-helix domain-containing protein n=1 Tax=Streptomyces sp. NPDC001634 TaxID=3154390 RepID=UPI0033322EC2
MADEKKNPLGPTGQRVQANVQRLREARGLSKKDLADATREHGRAIPPLGISRIEAGTRRVDADDLVALALALNVSPLTLLLPARSDNELIGLATDEKQLRSRIAWLWALGQGPAVDWEPGDGVNLAEPGTDPAVEAEAYEREQEYGRLRPDYLALANPPEHRRTAEHSSVRLARQLADLVEDLVSPEAGGGAEAARVRMALRRYQQLGIELEELQERFDPKPVVHPGVGFEQFRERLAAEGGIEDDTAKDDTKGE